MKKKLLALALILVLLLAGCGAGQSYNKGMPTGGVSIDGYPGGSYEGAADSWGDLSFSPTEKPGDFAYETSPEAPVQATRDPVSEKLIYRADLTIETVEFDKAVQSLETIVADLGGFIESSNVSGYATRYGDGTTRVINRSASYTLRVPADRYQEALRHVGDIGSVTNSTSEVENITSQFIDQDARKHSLEVQEERLLAMLEKAEDVNILIELESRLADVRYQIESIERTLRNWQQQVDYSTVRVWLREVEVYSPTASVQRSFGEKLADAFRDGWSGFLSGLTDLVLFLAGALPGLVLLAVIIAVVVAVLLRLRKKRKLARSAPAVPPVPADPAPGGEETEGK